MAKYGSAVEEVENVFVASFHTRRYEQISAMGSPAHASFRPTDGMFSATRMLFRQ